PARRRRTRANRRRRSSSGSRSSDPSGPRGCWTASEVTWLPFREVWVTLPRLAAEPWRRNAALRCLGVWLALPAAACERQSMSRRLRSPLGLASVTIGRLVVRGDELVAWWRRPGARGASSRAAALPHRADVRRSFTRFVCGGGARRHSAPFPGKQRSHLPPAERPEQHDDTQHDVPEREHGVLRDLERGDVMGRGLATQRGYVERLRLLDAPGCHRKELREHV